MAIGTTMSATVKVNVCEKLVAMIQKRSRYRINMIQPASQTSRRMSRLNGRESRNTKGTANWKITSVNPMNPQPPYKRRMYQVISSGKFPAQIISHCEKEKYAQTMTKVSIHLP